MGELLSDDPRVAALVESIAEIVIAPLRARVATLEAQLATTLVAHDALLEAAKPFVREGSELGEGWANERQRNTVQAHVKPNTIGEYRALCKAYALTVSARTAHQGGQKDG